MKLFAFIFGVYIIYLAALPGIHLFAGAGEQRTEMCCTDDRGCSETEQPSNGEKHGCNPFQSCHCCVGFNLDLGYCTLTRSPEVFQSHLLGNEKVPPHISLDFWQPPKIA